MTTALDIITDSLEKLGVYAPGEVLSAADSSRGLQVLDDMISDWIEDSIYLYQLKTLTLALQLGVQTYTVGPSGNVAVRERPFRVIISPDSAEIQIAGGGTFNIDSVSAVEWNTIYKPTGPSILGSPGVMFYLPSYPLGLLSVAPVPDANTYSLLFVGYFGLGVDLTSSLTAPDVSLAPGQQLALASNLAILLHTYFSIGNITPELVAEAQQTKTLLTLTNRVSRAMTARNVAPQVPVAPRP